MESRRQKSFQRYERWRDSIARLRVVRRMERWLSPHTHPGASVLRVAAVKLRVLAMFLIRRLFQGVGRRSALEGMRKLSGSARGRTVLLVGNGPSANRLLASEVAEAQKSGKVIVIATNYFFFSPHSPELTPDFIFWSDDVFHPRLKEKNADLWRKLEAHGDTTLVCPWTWRGPVSAMGLPNRVEYFDDDSLETWSKNISPLRPRGYQGTTGVKALAFGVHLGGSDVQMIGIDLSYIKSISVDIDNMTILHPTHVPGTDSGRQDLTPYTVTGLTDLLYSAANQFRAFHTHFQNRGIHNLDPDSLVDAFPKTIGSPFIENRSS